MGKKDTLIFDLFDLYCKYFEPYAYKIVISEETINLVFPQDRFPHLVGLTEILSVNATTIVEQIKAKDPMFSIKNLEKANNYLNIKFKVTYFNLIKDIFVNLNFYRVFKLPGRTQCKYMLLKMDNTTEINLGIDTDLKIIDSYIPRTYLVNTRKQYYGKFIQDSSQKDILRMEQRNIVTGEINLIYDKALVENNTENNIKKELLKYKYIPSDELIKNIITFNNSAKKYYTIAAIIKAYDDNSISDPVTAAMVIYIGDILKKQLQTTTAETASDSI